MKTIVLQDGNAVSVKERLKAFDFISTESIDQLDINDEKEL